MDNGAIKLSWLKELEASAVSLERIARSNSWEPKSEFEIVKSALLGFYSIKKLLEYNFLAQDVASIEWKLLVYPRPEELATKKSVNNLNCQNSSVRKLTINELSKCFANFKLYPPVTPKGARSVGLYCYSEKEGVNRLYYLPAVTIASMFLSMIRGRIINLNYDNFCEVITLNNHASRH